MTGGRRKFCRPCQRVAVAGASAAYLTLGSLSDADDAVHGAWCWLCRTEMPKVGDLSDWLTTVIAGPRPKQHCVHDPVVRIMNDGRIALRFLRGRSFACAVRRYNSHGCDETVSEGNDILDLLLARALWCRYLQPHFQDKR